MSVLIDVADEVVDLLNGAELSQPFEAQRVYLPSYDLTKDDGLKVFVLTLGDAYAPATRAGDTNSLTIKVALYQKVRQGSAEDMDEMMELRQEVIDLLRAKENGEMAGARFKELSNLPVYDPAQLDSHSTFVSVIEVNYELIR